MRIADTGIILETRSGCPIASTLDLVGDRWSLVIVRDVLNGKTRYQDFLDSPESIAPNILASRLKRLEEVGLMRREPYQDRPIRYEYRLTAIGETLLPVLQEICRWANTHLPETWRAPPAFMAARKSLV